MFNEGSEAVLEVCPPAHFLGYRVSGMYKGRIGEWYAGGGLVGMGPTQINHPVLADVLRATTLYKTELSSCQRQ